MAQETKSLIEQFYEHTFEEDWNEGLELYQSGSVNDLRLIDHLITAKIDSGFRQLVDVRIKIQTERRCIQWIECTCKKNRTTGVYCEHIAAMMIHIDRERPDIISKLDASMPLKPQVSAARIRMKKISDAEEEQQKQASSAQAVIEKFGNAIESAGLLAKGPTIRVRVEIKEAQLTNYDLGLDDAARFLKQHGRKKFLSPELSELKVFDEPVVEFGTRIQQKDDKVILTRVASLKVTPKISKAFDRSKLFSSTEKFKKISRGLETPKYDNYVFANYEDCSKYSGKEFLFVPEIGYFPKLNASVVENWFESPSKIELTGDQAAEFIESNFAAALQLGTVWLDESFKDTHIISRIEIGEVRVLDERDGWFKLDAIFEDQNQAVSMVDLIIEYRKRKSNYYKLKNKWIRIPELAKQAIWNLDADEKGITVDTLGLIRFKAAVGSLDKFVGSKKSLNHIRSKTEFSPTSDMPDISETQLNLREYQRTGLQWMWWLQANELHGLLADEMGLGKTHQAMGFLSAILKQKRTAKFLVICPTTVLDHWDDKVQQFAPILKPLLYHGAKRFNGIRQIGLTHTTLITSFGILMRDINELSQIEWDAVIVDEAHYIKNPGTSTYSAICKIKSRVRICMSGTPLENHLGELKAIYDFLLPGYLGSDDYFRRQFMNPISAGSVPHVEMNLQKLIHPFKLRRTKNIVLKDLPEKIEDVKHCHASDQQMAMYRETVALKADPLIKQLQDPNAAVPYLHVFAVLTLLKQICDHPALIAGLEKSHDFVSGKFELLKELLEEALGSGHKIVIFSQYLDMLELISRHLTSHSIEHVMLTGGTSNRGAVIEKFQTDPNCKVFCGSLLAGGIGIDLTAASVVIHYDRWWNASKENQATDRVHRIGQNKNVQVYKLVTRGTLEERIHQMIESKKELMEKFLDRDEDMFKNLSRSEILELLQ